MARKRAGGDTPTTTSDKATQAAGANGGRQEGQKGGPGGAGRGRARRGDKTEAVKQALARGLTSPTEIAEHVRRKHGLTITPAHVTTIKGTLKRKGGLTQPSAARESRQGEPAGAQGEQPAARPGATSAPGGLTPQDLASLAAIAERAGGVDRLQEFLAVLKRIR